MPFHSPTLFSQLLFADDDDVADILCIDDAPTLLDNGPDTMLDIDGPTLPDSTPPISGIAPDQFDHDNCFTSLGFSDDTIGPGVESLSSPWVSQHQPSQPIPYSDGEDDDEEDTRASAIQGIEDFVLSLLDQLTLAMDQLSRDEPFDDIKIQLVNRKKKPDREPSMKTIKYPGNARTAIPIQRLACLFGVLNYMHEALVNDLPSTKRDIFYRDVKLFRQQSVVDGLADDVAATLGLTRGDLNVRASPKGLFCGKALKLRLHDGATIHGNDNDGTLIPSGHDIAAIELDETLSWILVAEKEAVFQTLCWSGLSNHPDLPGPGIIITGKGYADIATRELVHQLTNWIPEAIPCLALVDADPHGLDILSVYGYGSQALKHEGGRLESPRLKWIGMKLSDLTELNLDYDSLIPLTSRDHTKALAMLKRPPETMPKKWRRELSRMLHLRRKAETEIISDSKPPNAMILDGDEIGDRPKNAPLVDYVIRKIWDHVEQ